MSGLVLLMGAFAGSTAVPPSPVWLTTINVAFGLVNLGLAVGKTDNLPRLTPILMEAATGVITMATAFATYLGGARHYALASAQFFAGLLYLGASVLHRRKLEKRRGSLEESAAHEGASTA